jgi:hypothetical protein
MSEVERLRTLVVVLEQEIARLKATQRRSDGAVAALFRTLSSEEYRCPGDHPSRPLTYEERMAHDDEGEYDEATGTWSNPSWQKLPQGVTWVGSGMCKEMVRLYWETEYGEYGSVLSSWPMADGPCADALRLEDDEEYQRPIWGHMMERCQLKGILKTALFSGRSAVSDLEWQLQNQQRWNEWAKEGKEAAEREAARVRWLMPRES